MFPGYANGSLASQFAYRFTNEIAPLVDYVIDFHSGGADRSNIPQIRCELKEEKTLELAKVFGAPYVVQSGYIQKSVRHLFHKLGKTILLFEGGKSKNLNESVISTGVRGAVNVMRYLGMHDGEIKRNKNQHIIEKAKWLRSPSSGMFQLMIENGNQVEKGEIIGLITDPYGEYEKKVIAPFACSVFCVNTAPIVNKGDALFHVSIEAV